MVQINEALIPLDARQSVEDCIDQLRAVVQEGDLPVELTLDVQDIGYTSGTDVIVTEAAPAVHVQPDEAHAFETFPWWAQANKAVFVDVVRAKSSAYSAIVSLRPEEKATYQEELNTLIARHERQLDTIKETVAELVRVHCSELQKWAADLAPHARLPFPSSIMNNIRGQSVPGSIALSSLQADASSMAMSRGSDSQSMYSGIEDVDVFTRNSSTTPEA